MLFLLVKSLTYYGVFLALPSRRTFLYIEKRKKQDPYRKNHKFVQFSIKFASGRSQSLPGIPDTRIIFKSVNK